MTRRFNGEGTFRFRPDGRWEGRLAYVDDDGARQRLSVYGATEKEARQKLTTAARRLEQGDPAKDSAVTVASWCDEWCRTTLEASRRKPTTKALMRGLVGSHVKTARIGAVPLAKLKPGHFDAWVLELRAKRKTVQRAAVPGEDAPATEERRALSDSSIARVFRVLSVILDGAVRDGHLARNPAQKVERPTAERHEARVLTPEELIAVLSAARAMDAEPSGHRSHNFALFATIAATGVRKGEALALQWSDVDFERDTLAIRGTLSRVGGQLVVTTPKTAKSRRVLPLAAGVKRVLREHRTAQIEDRLHAGSQWVDTGHVFATGTGRPRDPRGVLRSIEAASRRAGVADVNVHSLRHTAITQMLDDGTHLKAASEIAGHASTQITADVYAHLTKPTAQKAMDGLAAAIGL